jgi:hypothetical protein
LCQLHRELERVRLATLRKRRWRRKVRDLSQAYDMVMRLRRSR